MKVDVVRSDLPGATPTQRSPRDFRMNGRDRLEQLRGMLDRLERMPASPERDWLLAEVRVRTVDVETGAPPAPMRLQNPTEVDLDLAAEDQSAIKMTRSKPRRRAHERPAESPAPASVVRSTPPPRPAAPIGRGLDLLERGDVLTLEEPSIAAAGGSRPWTRGLRG
jgi:hypothetical protein